jgi:hypothetical protein
MPCRPYAFPAITTIFIRLRLLWEDNTFVPQLSPNSQIATPTKISPIGSSIYWID